MRRQVKCPSEDTVVPIANCHCILKVQCDKIHWKRVQEMRKHPSNVSKAVAATCSSLSIPNLNSPEQYFTLISRGAPTAQGAAITTVLHPHHPVLTDKDCA